MGVSGFVESREAAAAAEATPRLYTFVASTGDEDRNHNVLDPRGWDLGEFAQNPVVFSNHSWRSDRLPVGKAHRVWVESGRRLMATVEFADTPDGHEVEDLVEAGFLRAMSSGWLGMEFEVLRDSETGWPMGVHYHRQKLIELSVVGIPANPDALRVAVAEALGRDDVDLTNRALLEHLRAAREEMEEGWN